MQDGHEIAKDRDQCAHERAQDRTEKNLADLAGAQIALHDLEQRARTTKRAIGACMGPFEAARIFADGHWNSAHERGLRVLDYAFGGGNSTL